MLASQNGNLWNAELFAKSLGLSGHTVKRYMGFLEGAFMVSSLQPWFTNVGKRLVKSPKVYLRDSGILHAWFDFARFDDLLGNAILGASWEGYVIEQIKAVAGDRLQYFFYRTQQGAECDLVLVKGTAPIAAIEIKFSSAPTIRKGFHISVGDIETTQNFVIVPQTEDYPVKDGIWVVSLSSFLKKHLPGLI
jgi:predicted AAA+ superfamily ATPase